MGSKNSKEKIDSFLGGDLKTFRQKNKENNLLFDKKLKIYSLICNSLLYVRLKEKKTTFCLHDFACFGWKVGFDELLKLNLRGNLGLRAEIATTD